MKTNLPILTPLTMNAAEFARFEARVISDYARARVNAGDWDKASADQCARTMFEQRLPQGLLTPKSSLWTISHAETQRVVGSVWIQRRQRGGKHSAHILDLYIEENARGAGIGRATMQLVETMLRNEGIEEITLNVFADNHAALALYRTLGFEAIELGMLKRLGPQRERQ